MGSSASSSSQQPPPAWRSPGGGAGLDALGTASGCAPAAAAPRQGAGRTTPRCRKLVAASPLHLHPCASTGAPAHTTPALHLAAAPPRSPACPPIPVCLHTPQPRLPHLESHPQQLHHSRVLAPPHQGHLTPHRRAVHPSLHLHHLGEQGTTECVCVCVLCGGGGWGGVGLGRVGGYLMIQWG